MSKTGVDLSTYNVVDWGKVSKEEVDFAILKIIRKDLSPDKKFELHWNGCQKAGIPVQGVYNYSYATTTSKAVRDARKVLEVLDGRKPMVWLDVEDNCQKNLGITLIYIINAYADVIKAAGLDFGVYTGLSFYNSYIKPFAGAKSPLWIARYGKNNGKMDVKYQPQINGMIGWQYTSKGRVSGISGDVDMNVWYKEIIGQNAQVSVTHNPYPEPTRLLYKKSIMMRGNDVKWLQWELIRHGCLPEKNSKGKSNIDGIFGNDTSDATYRFQIKVGITDDRKVGVVTRAYLKN